MDAPVTVTARLVYPTTFSGSSTAQVINLNPSSFTRLVNISKAFEFYRFKEARFRLHPQTGSDVLANTMLAAYLPDETTVVPTFTQLSEQPRLAFSAAPATVPSAWIVIPRSVLLGGPYKWYKTTGSSAEDYNITQGQFWIAPDSTATSGVFIEIEAVVQFRGGQTAGLQP
jgi:hypothetical protein